MLKTVIKRDGSHEPFNPTKLNKWSRWAGEDQKVEWSDIVFTAIKLINKEEVSSKQLQEALIEACLRHRTWGYHITAGRLYASLYHKELYPKPPSVQDLCLLLSTLGLMEEYTFSDEAWSTINSIIDHEKDFHMAHFQLIQIRKKYAIKNSITKEEYETPQFVYMRMAIGLSYGDGKRDEAAVLADIASYYKYFSKQIINAPTPNFVNIGTPHKGFVSCCVWKAGDTAKSLAAANHIAYTMTYMSAGIGGYVDTRTKGDPVRGGTIRHEGKFNYFKSIAGAVNANLQAGRGGACTTYFNCFDPEIMMMLPMQHVRTPVDKQIRDTHFAMQYNSFICRSAARNEDVMMFTSYSAPDLHRAFFTGDIKNFELIYQAYMSDDSIAKTMMPARKVLLEAANQSHAVSSMYSFNAEEANRHTPFKDPIYSSNLCLELAEPTEEYADTKDLYTDGYVGDVTITTISRTTTYSNANLTLYKKDCGEVKVFDIEVDDAISMGYGYEAVLSVTKERQPEVALCSLGGIVVPNITTDEEYEEACYLTLKMIDSCIMNGHYELPHIGFTARNRINAGVGIVGLARHMARLDFPYNSPEGLAEIHAVAERHAYWMIRASLRLGKELGNAPWMHRTKWPEGWLPIDTYNHNVDSITPVHYNYDWEQLRKEIIANKGIRNSALMCHMPTESSSKASGDPNSVYPVEAPWMLKTDSKIVLDWCAKDNDRLKYQSAYDLTFEEQVKFYALIQKFTDQGISANFYKDRSFNIDISPTESLNEFLLMAKYGIKSKYYQKTLSPQNSSLTETRLNCVEGVCVL